MNAKLCILFFLIVIFEEAVGLNETSNTNTTVNVKSNTNEDVNKTIYANVTVNVKSNTNEDVNKISNTNTTVDVKSNTNTTVDVKSITNEDVNKTSNTNTTVSVKSNINEDVDNTSKSNTTVNVKSNTNKDVDKTSNNSSTVNVKSNTNKDVNKTSNNNSTVNVKSNTNELVDKKSNTNTTVNVKSNTNEDVDKKSNTNTTVNVTSNTNTTGQVALRALGHHRYSAYKQRLNWPQALLFCRRRKKQLATILHEDDHQAVVDEVNRLNKIVEGANKQKFWVGGGAEGSDWVWGTTGQQLQYAIWSNGQPKPKNFCLQVNANDQFKFNSAKCEEMAMFICQS